MSIGIKNYKNREQLRLTSEGHFEYITMVYGSYQPYKYSTIRFSIVNILIKIIGF